MQTILFLVLLLAFSAYGLPLEKDQDFDPSDSLYNPFSVGFANVANYDWIFQTIQKLEQEMEAKKKAKEMVLNNTPGLTIPRPFASFFSGRGPQLKHQDSEVLRQIEKDELEKKMAEELEAKKIIKESEAKKKAEEAKKSEVKENPWKIFTPMNFRIIG